jgi:hypothetical protein
VLIPVFGGFWCGKTNPRFWYEMAALASGRAPQSSGFGTKEQPAARKPEGGGFWYLV